MNIRNTFLAELKRKNKFLFGAIIAYGCICLTTALWGWQTTPFYIWAMYSVPVHKDTAYTIPELYADGKVIDNPHAFRDFHRMMFYYSVRHYMLLKDGSYNPKYTSFQNKPELLNKVRPAREQINDYTRWLKAYYNSQGRNYDSIKIYETTIKYLPDGHVIKTGQKLLSEG
jgi:hypothetical protein